MNDELAQALDRLLHDDLSDSQRIEVLRELEGNRDAVAYLADHALLTEDLRRSLKRRKLQSAIVDAVPAARSGVRGTSVRQYWGWAWIAALVGIVVMSGMIARWVGDGAEGISADIVRVENVLPSQSWASGQRVSLRQFTIETGRVEMRLVSGVSLEFEGPLQAEFVANNKLKLMRGRATADVGAAGKGFTIETANANVLDLANRFGIEVDRSSETSVVVFEGSVELTDPTKPASDRSKVTLTEGDAVRIDAGRKRKKVKMLRLGTDARSLRGPTVSETVTNISDNIQESDFRRYYGLLSGAMDEGARIFTTGHTRTWHSMPGGTFPDELRGGDVICTISEDRHHADLEVNLNLARACDLYVLADARYPAPDWLKRDFVDTGLRLRSGPWIPRETSVEGQKNYTNDPTAYIPHAIWKRVISQAGVVTLGAPGRKNHAGSPTMYGIVVKGIR